MTSYALALQKAVFDRLQGTIDGSPPVYDSVPIGALTPYVSFGPCDEADDDADCIRAVLIAQQIDVWTSEPGFVQSKRIAGAIRALLHRQIIPFEGATLTDLRVHAIRYLRDADGITSHAAIDLRASVEAE
ncbi:hypothetical protein NS365_04570 [Aureimonas ureilytica]|uniref:DUF3168 domain-containing protein n=1 Tax=Aureimonas ureilytica TaxID=401562 RepID=A0A175RUD8_9HYPH|nr:DUF3168 domain-containing protein [Aureimonas ureilytica]KTR07336.1 hypothetical protein NS365_04570 [Aureimonas ureilytica]